VTPASRIPNPGTDREGCGFILKNADVASDPLVAVDPRHVSNLRTCGASWKVVSQELRMGAGKACRALQGRSKNRRETGAANG